MAIKLKNEPPNSAIHAIWGPVVIIVIVIASLIRPISDILPGCVFHKITGFPCPTCGGTRCVIALARLDFGSACLFNPMILFFIVGLMIFSASVIIGIIFRKRLEIEVPKVWRRSLRYMIVFIFMANWIFIAIRHRT